MQIFKNKTIGVLLLLLFYYSPLALGQGGEEPRLLIQMLEKARSMVANYPDSAIVLADRALVLAKRFEKPEPAGNALITLGLANMTLGNWTAAESHYRQAIEIFSNLGDRLNLANAYSQLGYALQAQGLYDEVLRLQLDALEIREELSTDSSLIARSVGAVGMVYQNLGNLDQAMKYFEESLRIRQNIENPREVGIAFSLKNIGSIHQLEGRHDEALDYFQQALGIFERNQNLQFVETMYRLIGVSYLSTGEVLLAERYFEKALDIADNFKGRAIKARSLFELGKVYREAGQSRKAERYLKESLQLSKNSKDVVFEKNALQELSMLYEQKGQPDSAIVYFRKYVNVKDSLFNDRQTRTLAEIQTAYESEKKEQEIRYLTEKQARQARERYIFFAGLFLLTLLAAFAFWMNARRKIAFKGLYKEKKKVEGLLGEKEDLLQHLEDAQDQLVQSEKMASLGQLTAGIAHEINNPINFVSSNLEALKLDFEDLNQLLVLFPKLQDGSIDKTTLLNKAKDIDLDFLLEEMNALIEGMGRGATRTRDIVSSLKTFSRQGQEVFLPADIHEGIDAALMILSNQLKHRIVVEKQYGNLPAIDCQIDKLNQVFVNLINNASDAINGEGKITIKTSQQDNWVEIKIKDTGSGMDEATQKHIFEPFYTTKEIGVGTGLGLYISYGIIEQHHGNIRVWSKLEEGTEFTILLPIKQPVEPTIT